MREALYRTLIGDMVEDREDFASPRYLRLVLRHMVRMLELNQKCNNSADVQRWIADGTFTPESFAQTVSVTKQFETVMVEVMLQRRLAVTGYGHLCAMPVTAGVGDQILVLKGRGTSFVRKGKNAPKGKHEPKGDGYVHGFMHGEVLE